MKKFKLLAMMTVVLTIFSACQKDELAVEQPTEQLTIFGDQLIGVSVDNNCLILESEGDFQKLLDYLVQEGDDFFPEFEKTMNFDSYRAYYERNPGRSEKLIDDLVATILNPEGAIQIGDYLFKTNFKDEKTEVYPLNELKSENITGSRSPILFNWTDDVFALLNNEAVLKSYCSSDQDRKYDSDFVGWENSNSNFYFTAQAKLCYQNLGFIHTIISKFKIVNYRYSSGTKPIFLFEMDINGHYDRKNESIRTINEHIEGHVRNHDDEISWRPFYGTRRVQSFSLTSSFSYVASMYSITPFYDGYAANFTQLSISCN